MPKVFLPALRGAFGDRVYYSCLVPLPEIAARVDFADKIHKSKKLSEMIQRELKKQRAKNIANYLLHQQERFFNSLVIAVYGGKPSWHEISKIKARSPGISPEDIEDSQGSVGFLSFSGKEKLFAVDGQHRLAGIKDAVRQADRFGDDLVPVIFIAHSNSRSGLQRTRRLFTTLNKTAKPVSKGEIIALDEDDVMAIIARQLVEEHPFFVGERIAFNQTNNLGVSDFHSLTTIGNLYDVLEVVFAKIKGRCRPAELKRERPSDADLKGYYEYASRYFMLLREHFVALRRFFDAKNPSSVVRRHRGDFGGNVMFRPIGLTMMTEVIAILCRTSELAACVQAASRLPQKLAVSPYAGVLWDTRKHVMVNGGRALCRDLLLHALNALDTQRVAKLARGYAKALGRAPSEAQEVLRQFVEQTQAEMVQ